VLGKSLTGGYSPLSVACTSKEIAETIKDTWEYGHTWQPNMMGVAAALASLELLDRDAIAKIENRLLNLYQRLPVDDYVVSGLLSQFTTNVLSSEDLHNSGLTSNNVTKTFTSLTICTPMIADDEYFDELEKRLRSLIK